MKASSAETEKLARTFAMEYLTGHYRPLRDDEQQRYEQLVVVMLAFAANIKRDTREGPRELPSSPDGAARALAGAEPTVASLRERTLLYLRNEKETHHKRLVRLLFDAMERLELLRLQLETANNEIAEANQAHEWQPIDTVPQDREYVLVWNEDEGCAVYRFGPGLISAVDDPQWTHWMPLPDSPTRPSQPTEQEPA